MKKILICLLLLANLGTGLAFASDIHPEAAGHDVSTIDQLAGSDHDSSDGSDLHSNDHSCHGAAHLTGLMSNQSIAFEGKSRNDFAALSQTPVLLYISPFLRPPIA